MNSFEKDNIQGFCTVNGITLNHMARYMYNHMQFCMSKYQIKKIEKHLKDCPRCAEICNYHPSEQMVFNCPNCGKFMTFDSAKAAFTCKCNGIRCEKGDYFIKVISIKHPERTLTLWET